MCVGLILIGVYLQLNALEKKKDEKIQVYLMEGKKLEVTFSLDCTPLTKGAALFTRIVKAKVREAQMR